MDFDFRVVTYPEARAEYFGKMSAKAERALDRHVSKMVNDKVNAYDYAVQDKASELGWKASFERDAANVFSDDWMRDFGVICICAIRYSLGRMSYMPGLVQGFIRSNISMVKNGDIDTMIRDIGEHGGCDHDKKKYGMDCDYIGWMEFKHFLEAEINVRSGSVDKHDQT